MIYSIRNVRLSKFGSKKSKSHSNMNQIFLPSSSALKVSVKGEKRWIGKLATVGNKCNTAAIENFLPSSFIRHISVSAENIIINRRFPEQAMRSELFGVLPLFFKAIRTTLGALNSWNDRKAITTEKPERPKRWNDRKARTKRMTGRTGIIGTGIIGLLAQ